jgi:isopenicillin N synthase-like dioxygenase
MNSGIPVINAAQLDSDDTLRQLENACQTWGAFRLVEHSIADNVLKNLRQAMTTFFKLPLEQKRKLSRSESNAWGFYDQERTKNTLDWKEVYDVGPAEGEALRPQWPDQVPGFALAIEAFNTACERLSFELLAALARNLGANPGDLHPCFAPSHTSFLRLNYYPPCPQPARNEPTDVAPQAPARNGHLGINPHTDAGALTILLQDQQPGLELFHEGRWQQVASDTSSLVVNLGDIAQVWSNDRYRAPLHRVAANTNAERFSAPYFFNPSYQADYAPLATATDRLNPARYRSINWGEFRNQRARGDYADFGEEIQISQFRV